MLDSSIFEKFWFVYSQCRKGAHGANILQNIRFLLDLFAIDLTPIKIWRKLPKYRIRKFNRTVFVVALRINKNEIRFLIRTHGRCTLEGVINENFPKKSNMSKIWEFASITPRRYYRGKTVETFSLFLSLSFSPSLSVVSVL